MKTDVDYTYQTAFKLSNEEEYSAWLVRCASTHRANSLQLVFAFMDDTQLLELNRKHLNHNTLTDIITFDDSVGKDIDANIAISVERVRANATKYSQSFEEELLRVMAHGLLHCLGFSDKTDHEILAMRHAEGQCIKQFHVEQNPPQHV